MAGLEGWSVPEPASPRAWGGTGPKRPGGEHIIGKGGWGWARPPRKRQNGPGSQGIRDGGDDPERIWEGKQQTEGRKPASKPRVGAGGGQVGRSPDRANNRQK